jgi:hypothetical protein
MPLHKYAGVSEDAFADAFDEWELMVSLAYSDFSKQQRGEHLAPVGRFVYRHRSSGERSAVNRASLAIKSQGASWPYLAVGMFGGDLARVQAALEAMLEQPEMKRGLY